MAKVELTPELVADIKQKAKAANKDPYFRENRHSLVQWSKDANPATVLALVEEIERLQDQNYHLRLKSFLEALDGKQESEAGSE